MGKPSRDSPSAKEVVITVTLKPGTEEYRAYNRIKRKYHDEMAKRQKSASDDEPCETHCRNSEVGRGAVLALDRVPQEELPEYIDAALKPIGRPSRKRKIEDGGATDSDAGFDERATLLH
jgi:hypothetical protein